MGHHCHANGCHVATPPRLFMCGRHWAMVPKLMQDVVWATYRACPSAARRCRDLNYLAACADAVEYVARAESKPITNSYRRTLALLAEPRRSTGYSS